MLFVSVVSAPVSTQEFHPGSVKLVRALWCRGLCSFVVSAKGWLTALVIHKHPKCALSEHCCSDSRLGGSVTWSSGERLRKSEEGRAD